MSQTKVLILNTQTTAPTPPVVFTVASLIGGSILQVIRVKNYEYSLTPHPLTGLLASVIFLQDGVILQGQVKSRYPLPQIPQGFHCGATL